MENDNNNIIGLNGQPIKTQEPTTEVIPPYWMVTTEKSTEYHEGFLRFSPISAAIVDDKDEIVAFYPLDRVVNIIRVDDDDEEDLDAE